MLTAFPWQAVTAFKHGIVRILRSIITITPISKKDFAVYHICEELSIILFSSDAQCDAHEEYIELRDLLCCEERATAVKNVFMLPIRCVESLPWRSQSLLAVGTYFMTKDAQVDKMCEELAIALRCDMNEESIKRECFMLARIFLSEQAPVAWRISAAKCFCILIHGSHEAWLTESIAESHPLKFYELSPSSTTMLEQVEKCAALVRCLPDSMQNTVLSASLLRTYVASRNVLKERGGKGLNLSWCCRYLYDRRSFFRHIAVVIIQLDIAQMTRSTDGDDHGVVLQIYDMMKNIVLDGCECWNVKCTVIETIFGMLLKYPVLAESRHSGYCILFASIAELLNDPKKCDVSSLLRSVRVLHEVIQASHTHEILSVLSEVKMFPLLSNLLNLETTNTVGYFDQRRSSIFLEQLLPFQNACCRLTEKILLQKDMLDGEVAKIFQNLAVLSSSRSVFSDCLTSTSIVAQALKKFIDNTECGNLSTKCKDFALWRRSLSACADLLTTVFIFDTRDRPINYNTLLPNSALILHSMQDSLAQYFLRFAASLAIVDTSDIDMLCANCLSYLRLSSCLLSVFIFSEFVATSEIAYRLSYALQSLFTVSLQHCPDPNYTKFRSAILINISLLFQRYIEVRSDVVDSISDRIYSGYDGNNYDSINLLRYCAEGLSVPLLNCTSTQYMYWRYSHLLLLSLFRDCDNETVYVMLRCAKI